jgi:hypothetical protein
VNAVSGEQYNTSCVSCEENYFKLPSGGETVVLKFETIMEGKLAAVLTFTNDLLRNTHLSSLAYAIVSVDNRVTYITKEVLESKHVCLYGEHATYLRYRRRVFYKVFDYFKTRKRLAGCKQFTFGNSLRRRYMTESYWHTLYYSKTFNRWCRGPICECNLCVKTGGGSLKSLCINKLGNVLSTKQH